MAQGMSGGSKEPPCLVGDGGCKFIAGSNFCTAGCGRGARTELRGENRRHSKVESDRILKERDPKAFRKKERDRESARKRALALKKKEGADKLAAANTKGKGT